MTDPDTLLIAKVFQPLVDHFQLDPKKSCWSIFRYHAVGTLMTSLAYLAAMHPQIQAAKGRADTLYGMPLIGLGSAVCLATLMALSGEGWKFLALLTRLVVIATMAYPTVLMIMMIGEAGTNGPIRIFATLHAISWWLALIAVYVQACRKPSPPRDRNEAVRLIFR